MPGEGLQQLFVAEEFFKHLRRNFDEVAFGGKAGKSRPVGVTAKDGVHQVTEFVEEGDDVAVLKQAWVSRVASWEVTDQRRFRQVAATHAGDNGGSGEPLVLAFARMHVEIKTAD